MVLARDSFDGEGLVDDLEDFLHLVFHNKLLTAYAGDTTLTRRIILGELFADRPFAPWTL